MYIEQFKISLLMQLVLKKDLKSFVCIYFQWYNSYSEWHAIITMCINLNNFRRERLYLNSHE